MPPRKRRPTAAQKQEAQARRARALFEARSTIHKTEKQDVDYEESRLIQETANELERLGKLDTMLGAQALVIARGIVRGSGSELATLSKEHSRLMAALAAGQSVTSDPLDVAGDSVEEKRRRAQSAAGPKATEN